MQEIFQQLQGYFIGAVPTSLLFIVLVLAYQFLVQGPLIGHVEGAPRPHRRRRGSGAQGNCRRQKRGRQSMPTKLRQARAEIFKTREERIKQWNAERDAAWMQPARPPERR